MARVKSGQTTHHRHKKIFKLAKGYRMSRHRLYRTAQEAVLHAGEYAFAGRKLKKRDFRTLWIVRMNAALKQLGVRYSTFIHQLKGKNIELDRKMLALMANEHPDIFKKIVEEAAQK